MEHVARLFIKNGAKDKFEERLLDIGTDDIKHTRIPQTY